MTLADRVAVMSKGKLQQVGSPLEIYNRPKNVFVAEFLGNPQMNLITTEVEGDRIAHPSFSLPGEGIPVRKLTIGQRPEDMQIVAPEQGDFKAEIFTAELLGDATLITVRLGSTLVSVKAAKDCPVRMGDVAGVKFDRSALHLFDTESGDRLPDLAAPLPAKAYPSLVTAEAKP